jgi:hypothetical protein
MTTVSDEVGGNPVAADGGGSQPQPPTAPGVRRTRVTRAREGLPRRLLGQLVADARRAWVWREAPPPLRSIAAGWRAGPASAPSGALRLVWLLWNAAVAAPTTAALYVLAWVLQHPARSALAALIAAPVVLIWIK